MAARAEPTILRPARKLLIPSRSRARFRARSDLFSPRFVVQCADRISRVKRKDTRRERKWQVVQRPTRLTRVPRLFNARRRSFRVAFKRIYVSFRWSRWSPVNSDAAKLDDDDDGGDMVAVRIARRKRRVECMRNES